jgi:hypothetical protein
MEHKFEIEQWVTDATYRVNGGLPVQIIAIDYPLVQVWYPQGDNATQKETFIHINDIRK